MSRYIAQIFSHFEPVFSVSGSVYHSRWVRRARQEAEARGELEQKTAKLRTDNAKLVGDNVRCGVQNLLR